MPSSSERFQFLAQEFGSLVQGLDQSRSVGERTTILRRMKVLIVEVDMLISSSLRYDNRDTTGSKPPDQPAAEF